MGFADLSAEAQNIFLVRIEFLSKILIFAILILFCFYLVKYKKTEESPYLFVSIFKSIGKLLAHATLYISPLFIVFLYPQVALDLILRYIFIFYAIAAFVFGTIITLNIFYIVPLVLMKFGGYNPEKQRTNYFLKKIDNFLYSLPFIKEKRLARDAGFNWEKIKNELR